MVSNLLMLFSPSFVNLLKHVRQNHSISKASHVFEAGPQTVRRWLKKDKTRFAGFCGWTCRQIQRYTDMLKVLYHKIVKRSTRFFRQRKKDTMPLNALYYYDPHVLLVFSSRRLDKQCNNAMFSSLYYYVPHASLVFSGGHKDRHKAVKI